jgi:hypothetical protein
MPLWHAAFLNLFVLHMLTRSLANQQEKQLHVGDIAHVIYGLIAALVGDKWADGEYESGFSVVEAVRLCIKLADYNNDGYMSRAESALLTFPQPLFSALSPDGADGHKVTSACASCVHATRSKPFGVSSWCDQYILGCCT